MNSKTSLVSIITPSFNQAKYLDETIRSVLNQDYEAIEYILVDGGSTDGSREVIHRYADQFSWWVSERDSGQAEAINKGLAQANGDILAWLNSDDYYLPGAVSKVVKAFQENPEALLVYGNMIAVDRDSQVINKLRYRQYTLEDLLCFQIIGQPAVFFHRRALRKVGNLDINLHFLLDHHLWLRIANAGKICHVDETWSAARFHLEAKNRARAAEFGREAFWILDWARNQPELTEAIKGLERRAHASAYRVDARYRLDGGQPWKSFLSWSRSFFLHPPTALGRMNILASAMLQLSGLGRLRSLYFRYRRDRLNER